MKNKKILSRILALCSVVVLLFALALPCFADETEQPFTNSELWELFAQYDGNSNDNFAYARLRKDNFNDIDIYSVDSLYLFWLNPSTIGEFYLYDTFSILLDPGAQTIGEYDIGYLGGVLTLTKAESDEPNLVYDIEYISVAIMNADYVRINGYDSNGSLILFMDYSYSDGSYLLREIELGDGMYNYMYTDGEVSDRIDIVLLAGQDMVSDDIYRALTDDDYTKFHPAGFANGYMSSYISNRPDGVVPPAKTGLFGQLYYILSDAIYGENVILGSTQDFALTLVTTLLVLCVVLLPVLLVVAIMFKLFRW